MKLFLPLVLNFLLTGLMAEQEAGFMGVTLQAAQGHQASAKGFGRRHMGWGVWCHQHGTSPEEWRKSKDHRRHPASGNLP